VIRVMSMEFAVNGLIEGQANRHVQLYDTKGYR